MGKFEVTHSGPIPAGVSREKAISVLHDHEALFKASETYREHTETPGEAGANADKVPAQVKARSVGGAGAAKAYTVRNESPNPIMDSNVTSAYTVVDTEDGLWYYAASPMGVSNEALWAVKEGAGGLELSVAMVVDCNMMLKPIVKSQVTSNAQQIHKGLVEKMQG